MNEDIYFWAITENNKNSISRCMAYIVLPCAAAVSGVMREKPVTKYMDKDQTSNARNINQKDNSIVETTPKGPFVITGLFHSFKRRINLSLQDK